MPIASPFKAADAARSIYQTADDAWGAELRRIFKRKAGDIRYTPAGKGKPGTRLNELYLAREAAREAFYKEIDLEPHLKPKGVK